MATYMTLSFITNYLVIIIAMVILPNNILGFLTSANDSSMTAFHAGSYAKDEVSQGT